MKSKRLLFLSALGSAVFTVGSSSADTVTWLTAGGTWQNGVVGGFDTQFDDASDSATFGGNTQVGVVNISGTVNPTSVLINNTSGSYTFTGGTISGTGTTLTMNGAGGTAIISDTTTLSYTGDTTISAGTLQFNRLTAGTHNIGSGTVRLQGGTLKLSGNIASGTITVQNNFAVNASGGTIDLSRITSNPLWALTGSLDLSGNLNLSAASGGSSTGQSLFTGGITVNADATISAANLSNSDYTLGSISGAAARTLTLQASGITSKGAGRTLAVAATNAFDGTVRITGPSTLSPSSGVLFSSAASTRFADADIVIRDNGLLAVNYAVVGTSDFSNVTAGVRGGIKALGANGSFVNLGANTLDYVGEGGALVLDNGAATNVSIPGRLSDTAALALNSNQIYLNGREADTQTVSEDAGAITFAGGSGLTLRRDNNVANVVNLQVDSLTRAASSRGTFTINVVGTGSVLGTTANLKLDTDLVKHIPGGMASPTIVESNGHNWVTTTGAGPYTVSAFSGYTTGGVSIGAQPDAVLNYAAITTITTGGSVYGLRNTAALTATGQTIEIISGGLIANANITGGNLNFGNGTGEAVIYNSNNNITVNSVITATAGLTKFGSGSLTLNNTSSNFGGSIVVNQGTLSMDASTQANGALVTGKARLTVANGATVQVRENTYGGLNGLGTITAQGGNNGNLITELGANSTATFSGTLQNNNTRVLSLTKTGAGTQILGADSTASYTGNTTVSAGTLVINGNQSAATGAVSVAVGTTNETAVRLKGAGTVGGNTTFAADPDGAGAQVGGIHSPGNSVGKQTFDQTGASVTNLTYNSGSIFEWELASTPAATAITTDLPGAYASNRGVAYDAVNVTGTLSGSDAIFRVVLDGNQTFADTFWNANRIWTDIFRSGDGTGTSNVIYDSIFGGGFQYYNYSGAGTTLFALTTPTAEGSFAISGSSLTWTAVPEPTSALAGLLIGAGLLRRRRA